MNLKPISDKQLSAMVEGVASKHPSLGKKLKDLYDKYNVASGHDKEMLGLSIIMSSLYQTV